MADIVFTYNGKRISPSSGKVLGIKLPAIAPKTLRFKFRDSTIDPTQWSNVWNIPATWTKLADRIYDWHCDDTAWFTIFRGSGASSSGNSMLDTYRYVINNNWRSNFYRVDLDIIDSDLTGVTTVKKLFNTAYKVHHCSLKNTSSVQDWSQCFNNSNRTCYLESLDPLDMSSVDVSTLRNNDVFGYAIYINSPIVLNLPNVTSLQYLFSNCKTTSTITLNLSSSFTAATNRVFSFYNRSVVPEIIITGATGMTSTAYLSTTARKYTFTDWNPAGVDCSSMFNENSSLQEVSFPTNAKVTNSYQMFNNCTGLTSIPANLDLSAVTDTTSMFSGCTAIESGALSMYNYLSTKSIPVTSYTNCFTNCGSSAAQDATIHAEMAQIPTSWGGTMA